jgi:ABC-type multidrug transport system fused ATPase/permease subunit
VIVIAHRLSTVRRATKVVVMEDGHIVEEGSPAELLALSGRFARFHELQDELAANDGEREVASV